MSPIYLFVDRRCFSVALTEGLKRGSGKIAVMTSLGWPPLICAECDKLMVNAGCNERISLKV